MNPSKTITPTGTIPPMVSVGLLENRDLMGYRITKSGSLGYKHGHLFVTNMECVIPTIVFIESEQRENFFHVMSLAGAQCEEINV